MCACTCVRVDFSLCLKSTPITPIKDYMNEKAKQGMMGRGREGAGSYKKIITKRKHRCGTKQIVCEALNMLYMNVCVDVTFVFPILSNCLQGCSNLY